MKSFKQHTIRILSIIIIPFTVWLIIFNVYTIYDVSKENYLQNYEDKLSLIMHNIENELEQTDSFMTPFINNTNFIMLGYQTSQVQLFDATQQLVSLYKPLFTINSNISGVLVYSDPNSYYRFIANDYVDSNYFLKYLKVILDGGNSYPNKWYIAEINKNQYFVRIMNVKGAYQMCFIKVDKLLKSSLINASDEEAITVLSTYYVSVLQSNTLFSQKVLDHLKKKKSVTLNTSDITYIYTKSHSEFLDLDFVYAAPYHIAVSLTQIILTLVSLIIITTLIPLGTLKFRKTFLIPLDSLTDTMNRIKKGKINERCYVNSNISEYQQLGNTFNEMLEQIELLKIDSYEKALEAQKTELQYRHVQIRPHFFLNCLKTLYSMSECKDYANMQVLILAFSAYFRGVFGSSQMLSIKDELKLVNNYIVLQTNSSLKNISYSEKIDPRTEDFLIPSLTILTFIENSIKYGQRFDIPLMINVTVNLIQGDGLDFINISISDNGSGFNNDEINILNTGSDLNYKDGTHIGIANIKRRFRLLYGEEATITFMQSNGAVIELFLPQKRQEKQ